MREYKGKRYYLSLKGKWFPLDEEDEESLDKAIQDDWTLGAYIAGESAVCAWEDEWEVDEAPPYWHLPKHGGLWVGAGHRTPRA